MHQPGQGSPDKGTLNRCVRRCPSRAAARPCGGARHLRRPRFPALGASRPPPPETQYRSCLQRSAENRRSRTRSLLRPRPLGGTSPGAESGPRRRLPHQDTASSQHPAVEGNPRMTAGRPLRLDSGEALTRNNVNVACNLPAWIARDRGEIHAHSRIDRSRIELSGARMNIPHKIAVLLCYAGLVIDGRRSGRCTSGTGFVPTASIEAPR